MMIGDRAGRLILDKRGGGRRQTAAEEKGEDRERVEEGEDEREGEGGTKGKKKKRWSFGKGKKKGE